MLKKTLRITFTWICIVIIYMVVASILHIVFAMVYDKETARILSIVQGGVFLFWIYIENKLDVILEKLANHE